MTEPHVDNIDLTDQALMVEALIAENGRREGGEVKPPPPATSIPTPPPPPPPRDIDAFDDDSAPARRTLGRRPRKADIVEAIEGYRSRYPETVPPPEMLRSAKVKDLKLLLARIEKGDEHAAAQPEPTDMAGATQGPMSPEQYAQLMHFGMVQVAHVVEKVSHETSEYTGMEIKGASAQLQADGEQLRPLLTGVYLEHAKTIGPAMTPTALLSLYLLQLSTSHLQAVEPGNEYAPTSSGPPAEGQPTR